MRGEAGAPSAGFLTGGGAMGALIRAHDWSATPLGPPEAWPQPLRIAVGMVLGSRFPACIVWGPGLVTIYNDAFRPILGAKPEALGRPFSEVWSEAWATIGPIAKRAFAGEATFIEDFPLTVERNSYPEEAFFTFCYSPIRDEAGQVAGFLDTVVETTGKVLAERRQAFLLHLEERLRGLDEPRELTLAAAEALGRHVGAARTGYGEINAAGDTIAVERDWTDGIAASLAGEARLLDGFGPAVIAELRAGRTLVVEDCLTDPRTAGKVYAATWASIGTRSLVVVPLLTAGRLTAILYVHEPEPRRWSDADVRIAEDTAHRTWAAVERARAEAALRESEERLRLIVESARDYAIFTTDAEGRIDTWLPGAAAVFGWSAEEVIGRHTAITFTPEDRERSEPGREVEAARRDGTAPNIRWHLRKDGSRVFIEGSVTALRNPDGSIRGFLKIGQDVTERRAAEERQTLLAREVDHRAKNTLAVVQTMLRLTRADDVPSFARAVEGRVAALARTQTLLAEERWNGAALHAMLRGELAPFLGSQRADLSGPPVVLPAGTAQPLAMAVHELATNAVKHGALSVSEGHVSVSWRLEGGAPGVLRLRWEEANGPPVTTPPMRRGFGSRVLEGTVRGQLGGAVTLCWSPTGLVCEMDVPLGRDPVPAGTAGLDTTAAD